MKIIKKLLLFTGIILLVLVLVLFMRTLFISPRNISVNSITLSKSAPHITYKHLSEAIQFKTISYPSPNDINYNEFTEFRNYLKNTFPKVHQNLTQEVIGQSSLLYTWQGREKDKKPVILAAHMDVVPIETNTEQDWQYSPFSGEVAEGYIWGRGSMDNKGQLIGILEAVEYLLNQNFRPQRTIYLAFGHDEEVFGFNGARKIASLLKSRNITPECIIDEGGAIVTGVAPGISKPVALIGTAEKGYLSIELSVKTKGGHSANPPRQTAIGILSAAINRLEKNRFKASLKGSTGEMLEWLAPEMKYPFKIIFANPWISNGLVKWVMEQSPSTDASIRTTTAVTVFQSGVKDNILPVNARAIVNFRILPGESINSTMRHVKKTINDPRVSIKIFGPRAEPSLISSTESSSFMTLEKTIKQVFGDIPVAPYLITGSSDSKHYKGLTKNIYRFTPLVENSEDFKRPHGTNERISIENYQRFIHFYVQLFDNLNR